MFTFRLLIGYTENLEEDAWKGFFYAMLFFVSSMVNSFLFHQVFYIGMNVGMRIKAAIISLVYTKVCTPVTD